MEKPAVKSPLIAFLTRNAHIIIGATLTVIIFGILILCGGLAYLLITRDQPVSLPAPTGTYPVGRVTISWKDARPDLLVDGVPQAREYVVFIWYPAAPDPGVKAALYLPKDWASARTNDQGLGAVFQQDPSAVQSYAVENAQLASTPAAFPVLIFEPGYGPIATDYTTLAEDLASHGYVVAGITPLESAPFAVMPDGRIIKRTAAGSLPEGLGANINEAANKLILAWDSDFRSTWTQLNSMNRGATRWNGRLDMAHTGFFGHSFGGAAALNVCAMQVECLAAADLDGTLFGPVTAEPLQKPTLFLWSQNSADPAARKLYDSRPDQSVWKELPGVKHYNFTDMSLEFNPLLRAAGMLGSANPVDTLQTVRLTLRQFFDSHLR